MQIAARLTTRKVFNTAQTFVARRANIELKISCLVLLWPGVKWFRTSDYSHFYRAAAEPLEDARGILGL